MSLPCLNVQIAGTTTVNQSGRTVRLTPGDMVLYDSRMPHHGRGGSDVRGLLLRIPRNEIIHRIPYLEAVSTVAFDSSKAMTRLAFDMLLSSHRQLQTGRTETDAEFAGAVLDTIAAAASSSFRDSDDHFSSSGRALLHRVKLYIDRHLFTPELDPEQIARAHQVSVRYLNKLFAGGKHLHHPLDVPAPPAEMRGNIMLFRVLSPQYRRNSLPVRLQQSALFLPEIQTALRLQSAGIQVKKPGELTSRTMGRRVGAVLPQINPKSG